MNNNKKIFIFLGITFPIVFLVLISSIIKVLNVRKQHYIQAFDAYQNGDCELANQKFAQVLESSEIYDIVDGYSAKAKQYKTTCDYFIKINNLAKTQLDQNRPDLALIEYLKFPQRYENDFLTTIIKSSVVTLFLEYTSNGLSSPTSCDQINYITAQKIIPTEDTHFPYFYRNCVNIYLKNGEQTKAHETMIEFLEVYQTNHHLSNEVMLNMINNKLSCDNLPQLKKNQAISQLSNFLPTLMLICGAAYQNIVNYSEAEKYYNLLLVDYADDSLFTNLATRQLQNLDKEEQELLSEISVAAQAINRRVKVCLGFDVTGIPLTKVYEIFSQRNCYTGQKIGFGEQLFNVLPFLSQLKILDKLDAIKTLFDNLESTNKIREIDQAINHRELLFVLLSDVDNQEILSVNNNNINGFIKRKKSPFNLAQYQNTAANLLNRNEPLVKPFVGFSISSLNPKLAQKQNGDPEATVTLPEIYGVYVHEIFVNTPAQKAGLLVGDIVTHVDHQPIQSLEQLLENIANRSVGEVIHIKVLRNNTSEVLAVEIGNFHSMNID